MAEANGSATVKQPGVLGASGKNPANSALRPALMNVGSNNNNKRPAPPAPQAVPKYAKRMYEDDSKDEEENEENQAPVDERDAGSQSEFPRRPRLFLAPVDDEAKKSREWMEQLRHSNRCQKSHCAWKRCEAAKIILCHLTICASDHCLYSACPYTKKLMAHHRECAPEQGPCKQCGKRAPLQYKGKDYFADLKGDVLRHICVMLRKDNKSLNALQQVNKRVHSFFQLAGEIKGLYAKTTYPILHIIPLADGSMQFHFVAQGRSDGYVHILAKNGDEERFWHSASKKGAMYAYIVRKYGLIDLAKKHKPVPLPPTFYDALALALQKFDFNALILQSVEINGEEFDNFIFNKRSSQQEIHIDSISIKYKNVIRK